MKKGIIVSRRGGVVAFILNFFFLIGYSANHFVPVWEGENGFGHINIIVVSAFIDGTPMEIGDEVGIFDDDLCVGVGVLESTISGDNMNSFLHLVVSMDDGSGNGFTSGDSILFRLWDKSLNKEHEAYSVGYKNGVNSWLSSGKFAAGATAFVDVLGRTQIRQQVLLKKGWNIMSPNILLKESRMENIMGDLMNDGVRLKVMDEAGKIFENIYDYGGWLNQIGNIKETEGYKIGIDQEAQLNFIGYSQELPMSIPLKKGWNIISYPLSVPVSAGSVFQKLIDKGSLIKVQDEQGQSFEYWSITDEWVNNIGLMQIGKGYLVKVNRDETLIFESGTYKSAGMDASYKGDVSTYFNSTIIGNGVDHMNINVILDGGFEVGDEIAAYHDDVCVGAVGVSSVNISDGRLSLIASGSSELFPDGFEVDGEIIIKVWDKAHLMERSAKAVILEGEESYIKNGSTWVSFGMVATDNAEIDSSNGVQLFPNPANNVVSVDFDSSDMLGNRLEIVDATGRVMESRTITGMLEEVNIEDYRAGVYLVVVTTDAGPLVNRLMVY